MQTSGTDSASNTQSRRSKKRYFKSAGFEFGNVKLIQRHGTGVYYLTWYDRRLKRMRRQTTDTCDLEQAKQFLIDKAHLRQLTVGGVVPQDQMLIDDVFNGYLVEKMTPENASWSVSKSAIEKLQNYFDVERVLWVSDLTAEVIDGYSLWRQKTNRKRQSRKNRARGEIKTVATSTIRRELNVLTAALNHCHSRNRILSVPNISKPANGRPRDRWLTPIEVRQLMAATESQRIADFIMLGIHTLQRPKYLYELRREQVDLENRIIDFRDPDAPQNRKRRPVIRMSEALVPICERLIKESYSGYLLERYGQRIKTDLRQGFKRTVQRAKLENPDEIVPYTLRHTGATWLAQAGVPLIKIAGMMGHTTTATLEKHYIKHSPVFQDEVTSVLDRLVQPFSDDPQLLIESKYDHE